MDDCTQEAMLRCMHELISLDVGAIVTAGPDKSIAQLPGTNPNFGWASDFLFHLPRKMYRMYREYCNSEPFSRCCGMPGKWLKLGFVRPCY